MTRHGETPGRSISAIRGEAWTQGDPAMERTRRLREDASAGTKSAQPKYHDSGEAAPSRELSLDSVMEDMRAILLIDRRDREYSASDSISKSDARK